MGNTTLIFQHIPKTGGTTLGNILDSVYGKEVVRVYNDVNPFQEFYRCPVAKPKVLMGHFPYGIHRLIPGKSVYITLLRDPVERLISQYNFISQNANNPTFPQFRKFAGWSLEKYISKYIDNHIARFLIYRPHTIPQHKWMEAAKQNLSNYEIVGLTENFDSFVQTAKKMYGWKVGNYPSLRVTKDKKPVSQKARKLIEEKTQIDREIYKHFVKKYKMKFI